MSSDSPNLNMAISNSQKEKIQNLHKDYSLLAPGPVNLHPAVRTLLAEPMIHHRTPAFDQIFSQVKQQLKSVFQTQNEVFILSSTGSGGMECALLNCLSPGDTVLALVSGKFGERWADMAEVFGAKVIRYDIPWGESADLDKVKHYFSQHPEIKILLTQACETSTAVFHPLKEIGILCKNHNCLFLVDGITAVGACDLAMDRDHIDALVAGSQKAFMLPTGLSFLSFSDKAWKKIKGNSTQPRYYFDILREKKANDKGETFFSSSVSLIKALRWVLTDIENKSFEKHLKIIASRAQATRDFYQQMGLKLFSNAPSTSLTAILTPDGVDSQSIRAQLESEFQITIMGGQDQLKGKILRIGHMGYIQATEMQKLFVASMVLIQLAQKKSFDMDKILQNAETCSKQILDADTALQKGLT